MHELDWIDREAYPFASHHLEVPAGRMHFIDEGAGSPVVMIHGNPTWSFLYRHLIKRLRSGYRCVAMDHIGFGLSDKPPDWSYLPQEHARNLALLIEKLDLEQITLVVQDWGGPIGLSYAVDRPENVARLVIMNSWAWPVDRDPYYIAFSALMGGPIGRLLIRRCNVFATQVMRRAFGDPDKLTPELHAQYLHALPSPETRKGSYVFPGQITGATPWLRGIWDHLSALRDHPTLIAWGMKDIAFRKKELRRWQRAFPRAETMRLPGAGHFVQEEAPDELAEAVLRFLKTT